ncbi:uncharacterized protein F4812DRAFT_418852 [Daldinia caldariorum]|uniref:uncharacterized protein n=1 Tax=Daldinia caldariorum TaxID=326644 RepID=UPI0020084953|nr:uncharacterized protein F4812DRAFT_418852 [Daldinia caldariorum]KAI1470748.1 hypothetical protein F4812DRAFT_418852 [Daldinia caldariorum]
MADEQVSLTSLILIIVLGGLIIRYLFFSPPAQTSRPRDAQAISRAREAAVERVQQIFGPDRVDRRTILWDLHRNGGNIAATTERILAGRIETPPVTFQPPPPPTSPSPSATQTQPFKAPPKPAEPDLITRYKLQDKIRTESESESSAKSKAWSSNRNERQASLQRRRDEMILAARRKMEAKIAAEKAARNVQQ